MASGSSRSASSSASESSEDSSADSSGSSEKENSFGAFVEATFTFNTSGNVYIPGSYEMLVQYPITFHDRHLDDRLAVKRIEIIPSLAQLLADTCDEEMRAFHLAVRAFYPPRRPVPGSRKFREIWSSDDVADAYHTNLGKFCIPFPSQLHFHPRFRGTWYSVFEFKNASTSEHGPTFPSEAYLCADYAHARLYQPNYIPEDDDVLDAAALSKIRELATHSPQLAIWDFYPMTLPGEKLIKSMQNISQFVWETSHTMGLQATVRETSSSHDDSQCSFIGRLLQKKTKYARISRATPPKKSRGDVAKVSNSIRKSAVVVPSIPSRSMKAVRPYRVHPPHFMQHAWVRAVTNDATFIIFNCGRYERIGVRHRASQTLYLSELIDTVDSSNPAYGKIHVGLHFAIFQDALDRQRLRLESSKFNGVDHKKKMTPQKRKLPPDSNSIPEESRHSKRRKVTAEQRKSTVIPDDDSSHIALVSSALSTRDLALVNLDYGIYRSLNPASFIRRVPSCAPGFYMDSDSFKEPRKRASYRPHQYFYLTLSAPIETGSTGTAHRASAEITLESGEIVKHNLIVKLVFLDRDNRPTHVIREQPPERTPQKALWQEYMIYQRLASAGVVEGILPVYGIFEDIDSGTLALIMEDGGISLCDRQLRENKDWTIITMITPAERRMFLKTMESIHKAGIRHRDIRSQNLVVDSKDKAYIIDFDRAELQSFPSEPLDREMLILQHIVDGQPTPNIYSF